MKCLSYGGRLTLIKSVLGFIGSYMMSIFPVPVTMLKEKLRAAFFWEADLDERLMH